MKTITTWALCCALTLPTYASHLLGGQIQARNTTGNTYEITVVLLLDRTNAQGTAETSTIPLCLGDGSTITLARATQRLIDPAVSENVYRASYTYAGPGVYRLTTQLLNRTTTVNANPPAEAPFVLSTTIQATGNFRNASPAFEPTADFWQVSTNQRASLRFRFVDADNDSLSYAIVRPLSAATGNGCSAPTGLNAYQFPNDVARAGTYKLDSRTGGLIWDAPTRAGQYSVAVVIREWRNGIQIGETYAETVIRVQDKGGASTTLPPYEPATENSLVTGTSPESEVVFWASPNPMQHRLTVQLRLNAARTASVHLYSLAGHPVASAELTTPQRDHTHTFEVGNLPAGLYILKANVDGRVISRTVLKQ
ncbi:T9SS type A sorting domain-containing protein [Rudanella paleaurantiibacter]|uniref:T9SS type A sorting domain-containing protein n=1 Tax=Rudanella paleaurantiibacter TaxID=2614655 RepID=A0A7J5U317_9BACT|nr:T9SS type A sorting domain-containing protein [Rudanella paleaurantiibacter]KAB7732187.1 T9SS type A sorting domain-containing protein [Rudanella paleaurantiibacter]